MSKRFQYQVCWSLSDHVTFVNGKWQGEDIPEAERQQKDMEGCPRVWDCLQCAGAEGWELVWILETPLGATKGPQHKQTLFLKRELE